MPDRADLLFRSDNAPPFLQTRTTTRPPHAVSPGKQDPSHDRTVACKTA